MIGDEDLDAIFSESGEFTQLGTFDVSGSPLAVYGIFTDLTQALSILTNEIETNDASFACKTSAIATVKRDMTVVINAVTYTVKRIQTLGTGSSLVTLKT